MFTVDSFFIGIPFILSCVYAMHSIDILIKTVRRFIKKEFDELEKKAIVDSLALSMIVVFSLHIIQMILSLLVDWLFKPNYYIPTVNSGLGLIGDQVVCISGAFFDVIVFSISYNLVRYKYDLNNKKEYSRAIFAAIYLVIMLTFLAIRSILKLT